MNSLTKPLSTLVGAIASSVSLSKTSKEQFRVEQYQEETNVRISEIDNICQYLLSKSASGNK
jgi:hypothetical protein